MTNSLARHVETQASELTLGQLQENLDSLSANVDVLKDRLVVLNARVGEIETSADVEDTETQVELSRLREERLQLEQSIVDIESTIRVLNTELQTFVVPVVIVDSAQAPTSSENPSVLILGSLGFVLGLLVGGCVILFVAYRNRSVIDRKHLESLSSVEVIATIPQELDKLTGSTEAAFLISFVKLRANKTESIHTALVTPKKADVDEDVITAIQDRAQASGLALKSSQGVLNVVDSIHAVSGSERAVLLVQQGKTASEDYVRAVKVLRDLEVEVIGTVMVLG